MAGADSPQDAAPTKRSKLPLAVGLAGALAGGGGGFYATYSGLLWPAGGAHGNAGTGAHDMVALPEIAFVPIEPVIVSLDPAARNRHLRMTAQLEVEKPAASEVTVLLPRIVDVLNGYLRAIEVAQLEDPAALVRIRAQLLRRIQVVAGEGRVRDLLITEFVLN